MKNLTSLKLIIRKAHVLFIIIKKVWKLRKKAGMKFIQLKEKSPYMTNHIYCGQDRLAYLFGEYVSVLSMIITSSS